MKNIGDKIYWVESSTRHEKTIHCPMCFGKLWVKIILGDGSEQDSRCDACRHGYGGPTGYMTTWEPDARIKEGVITGISTRDGHKYEVGYTSVYQAECFDSAEAAEELRKVRFEQEKERADLWYKEHFVNCKKKQIWSAHYHRERIKDAEKTIQWHKSRLEMIKTEAKNENK